MKLAYGRLRDKASETWEQGGCRRRCGFLAGAFGTAYLAGLAGGNMLGLAGVGALSMTSAVDERRFDAADTEFDARVKVFKVVSGGQDRMDARLKELRKKSDAVGHEMEAMRSLMGRRGLDVRSLEAGIRRAVSPLEAVVLKNVEIQRRDLEVRIGPRFPSYRLLFFLHSAMSDYLVYRNTAGNSIPRDINTITETATGDCKDQSAILASLSLAAGLNVKFVSWSNEDSGHAYLFVRIFEKPSESDMRGVEENFTKAGRAYRVDMVGQGKPVLRRFDDGLYIACDPTNHLIPGLIDKEYLGPKEKIKMIGFRPEDYGLRPCNR